MNKNEIIVSSCMDCPFYQDDSDYGESCYHGVPLQTYEKDDYFTLRIQKVIITTIPKKCPLLEKSFTVSMTNKILEQVNKTKVE